MSNINAKSINVGRLNVTENFIYHRGKKTKMLDVDASGNLCLTNSIFSNEPFKLGINICPGTTVTDGSANQILNAALDISGGLQLAFNDVTTMPTTNNLGSVSFFKDGSGNYRFFVCEMDTNSLPTWRAMTESHALASYWSKNGNDLFYTDGNVGIGTNAPSAYLHVESTAPVSNYAVPQVLITADAASNYNQWASLELRGSYIGNTVPYGVGIRTTYGHDINYRTYGDFSIYTADKDNGNAKTDRLTVTSTGDIGIGTTTPQAKLEVSGGDALIHEITVGRGATDGTTTATERNTAVGYQALYNNTIGYNNVATGYQALNKNTTGQYNVATGMNALRDNLDGGDNTASGTSALELNTSGNKNVAIGTSALLNNKVGNNNVAIGYNAGPTTNNLSNTISIGANVTPANSNSCVIGNPSQNINVGIGTSSPTEKLEVNGTVKATTFVGNLATTSLTGSITNAQLAGSIANVKLANSAITIAGSSTSLGGTITADDIAGQISSSTITNAQLAGSIDLTSKVTGVLPFANGGTGLSSVGSSGQVLSSTGSEMSWVNTTEHGPWTTTTSGIYYDSGNVGIGTTSPNAKLDVTGDIKATGDIISNVTSDIRFKTNINKIENPLEKISKINGYTYDWIQSDLHPYNGSDTGIIAQEVETMDLPGMVVTRSNGYKGVKYERLVPLLVESIKSLQETVTKQQEQINQLMKK